MKEQIWIKQSKFCKWFKFLKTQLLHFIQKFLDQNGGFFYNSTALTTPCFKFQHHSHKRKHKTFHTQTSKQKFDQQKKEERKSNRKEAKVADLLEHPLDGANLVLEGHGLELPLHPRPLGAAAAAHRPAHRHPPPPVTAVGHTSPPPDLGIRKDLGQGVARKLKP